MHIICSFALLSGLIKPGALQIIRNPYAGETNGDMFQVPGRVRSPKPAFQNTTEEDTIDCLFSCFADNRCVSLNYGNRTGSDNYQRCELLDYDKHTLDYWPDNEPKKEDQDFVHLSPKTACDTHPCESPPFTRCVPRSTANTDGLYECVCHLPILTEPKDEWVQLNEQPVCYEARDDRYGVFKMPFGFNTKVAVFKLTYVEGYVAFKQDTPIAKWGNIDPQGRVFIVISDTSNRRVFPTDANLQGQTFYTYPSNPPFHANDEEVFLRFLPGEELKVLPCRGIPVVGSPGKSQEEYRLWFAEDFLNANEMDNTGMVCANVSVKFTKFFG